MDLRENLAREFYAATGAELAPFVSDEANWLDLDYLEQQELFDLVAAHYGVRLNDELIRMPFWQLLDYLHAHRRR